MGSTAFGNFHDFCVDATLPICNIFNESSTKGGKGFGGCELTGIPLKNGQHLANLGSILIAFFAILTSLFLLWRSERKQAAVGRREIQLFLVGYIIIEICEIFTTGGFPLAKNVRLGFTAVHIAAITATMWILLLNGIVGFQLIDDGTGISMGGILISAAALFVGTGYIALDSAFSWTGRFDSSLAEPNQNIGLYVLYQLFPLVCLVVFFVLETILVIRVLGERKPMLYLFAAAILFALGQIFNYTVSPHICTGTKGKINGSLFETLFTMLSVIMVWVFWSSITEDDWPMPASVHGSAYT